MKKKMTITVEDHRDNKLNSASPDFIVIKLQNTTEFQIGQELCLERAERINRRPNTVLNIMPRKSK